MFVNKLMRNRFTREHCYNRIDCYNDRVSIDTSNKMFYIYDLGRYNNKHFYHFGECQDIYESEFNLKRSLPLYECKLSMPVNYINGLKMFETYIDPKRCYLPIDDKNKWDVFCLDEVNELEDVLTMAKSIYE